MHDIKKTFAIVLLSVLSVVSGAVTAEPPYVTARFLTPAISLKIAEQAEARCAKMGYQISVAVVDRYGNLLGFARHPLAGAHTITIAEYKAFTAATFQGATIDLTERLSFLKGTPKLSLVGGGVPVKLGGFMYGAVGVSGAPAKKIPGDVDHACAQAGIDAVQEAIEFGSD